MTSYSSHAERADAPRPDGALIAMSGSSTSSSRSVSRLRLVGMLEGVSYLVLLAIAMPLKYLAGLPEMVRIVGWAHGLLFILFLAAVAHTARTVRWPARRVWGALAASVIPFGPFVLDGHLRRDLETRSPTADAVTPKVVGELVEIHPPDDTAV